MRKRFGRNDIILISVIVIISVALLLVWKLVYLKGQDTDSDACVEVTIDGRAYGTYPLSKDDTIEINGITYKIEKYEHTTEFGNRNKDTVADYLKDSCEGNIDENYNLSNGYSYLFITLTFTYKDGDDKQID